MEKVNKLSMCRICLAENVRMYVVTNKSLQEMYEKLTDVPFVTEDRKPMLVCSFCCTRLKQCCQLQRKCVEAEELLTQMLDEDYEQKPFSNQGYIEFVDGFVITPIENISIVDDCLIGSDAINQELPAVCEEQDDVELQLANPSEGVRCQRSTPGKPPPVVEVVDVDACRDGPSGRGRGHGFRVITRQERPGLRVIDEFVSCDTDALPEGRGLETALHPKRMRMRQPMSFKIVKTIENGEFHLWTVPYAWESDGELRMPNGNMNILRRDKTSIPDGSWRKTNCILKRSGFMDFESAEAEIKAMKTVSSADKEINARNVTANKTAPQKFAQKIIHSTVEFGTHANEIKALNEKFNGQIAALNSKIDGQIAALSSKMDGVMESQIILSSNQESIMQALSTYPEASAKKFNNIKFFQPIANKTALDELEDSLKIKENADNLIKTLTIVCGHGKGRAINNAYALIDAMFDRNFLQNCSWAGGSRGTESKICFKSYNRVINLFFQIIHISDAMFTQLECKSFLQSVLRNAKKRNEAKRLRASGPKRRPKIKPINRENENSVNVINMCNDQIDIVHEQVKKEIILLTDEEISEDNEGGFT